MYTVYAADAAATAAPAAQANGSTWQSWLLIIIMFAAMYFFLIRPQNKKDKEAREMRSSLKPGDEVVTIGGICGTVARVKEDSDRVVIMVGSDRTKLEILKNAIAEKRSKGEQAPSKAVKAKTEEDAEETPSKPNKKNIKKLGEKAEPETPAEAPAEEAK